MQLLEGIFVLSLTMIAIFCISWEDQMTFMKSIERKQIDQTTVLNGTVKLGIFFKHFGFVKQNSFVKSKIA